MQAVRLTRWLIACMLLPLLLLAALALPGAPRALAFLLEWGSAGKLKIEAASGQFYREMRAGRIELRTRTRSIDIEDATLVWRPVSLLTGHLDVTLLAARRVNVGSPVERVPLRPPESLRMPLRVTLREMHVAAIEIARGPAFQHLRLSGASHGKAHEWTLRQLITPFGRISGAGKLDADAPFTLAARAALDPLPDSLLDFSVHGELAGTLETLGARLDAIAGAARLVMRARIEPFASVVVPQARLEAHHFDPAAFLAGAPHARLDGELHAEQSARGWQGHARLVNRVPGPIDRNRLPLTALRADLVAEGTQAARMSGMVLDHGVAGTWHGEGRLALSGGKPVLHLDLATRRLDLHGLHNAWHATRLAGGIELRLSPDTRTAHIELAGSGLAGQRLSGRSLRVGADLVHEHHLLRIARLEAAMGNAKLQLQGQLGFDAQRRFSASGRVYRLDPSQLGSFPAAHLSAKWTVAGAWPDTARREIKLDLELRDSVWRNQPLSGGGKLTAEFGRGEPGMRSLRLRDSDLRFALGDARMELRGAYGSPGDRLDWRAMASNLAVIDREWLGAVDAHGWLAGRFDDPEGELVLRARDVRLGSGPGVKAIEADLALGPRARDAMHAAIRIRDARVRDVHIHDARVDAEGLRHAHRLRIELRGKHGETGYDLHAAATGGWKGHGWQGTIESLASGAPLALTLVRPASLRIAREAVELDEAPLALLDGTLRLEALRWSAHGFSSRGRAWGLAASRLPAHPALAGLQGWHDGLSVGAYWDVRLDEAAHGEAWMWRERGELLASGQRLGLARAQAQLRLREGTLYARLDATGDALGDIEARASAPLQRHNGRWGVRGDAPLAGYLGFDMRSLAWLGSRLDVRGALRLDGHLRGTLDLSGTVARPRARGAVRGRGLTAAWPEQGFALREGRFEAFLEPDRLRVSNVVWRGAETARGKGGTLHGGGELKLAAPYDGKLEFGMDALEVLSRPDRQLTASGRVSVTLDAQGPRVTGQLRADRALFVLPEATGYVRSEDVVVRGAASDRAPAARRNLELDLELDAGPDFMLRGRGLDARLAGAIRLTARSGQPAHAVGRISVAKGIYRAYGQKLDIDRGVLDFTGLLDNPGLDILAMRRFPDQGIEAGVSVTGTLLLPRARLVSKPEMADEQKLAWLVLGHGLDTGDRAAFDALHLAATSLLSSADAVSLQARIAQATGLDDIGVRGASTVHGTAVTLGKRLSERAYLSFEQSLDGLSQLARLKYQLSRRLTVEAQSGTEDAVDVFYTFSFD